MRILETRVFEGKNIYCLDPVIRFIVDLESLEGVESNQVSGFNHQLLNLLPGLRDHYCSRGRKGGFVERLNEGTYFGHILEHVALELQGLTGSRVYYGKTRNIGTPGQYEIILEYEIAEVAKEALVQAIRIIGLLLVGKPVAVDEIIEQIRGALQRAALGPSTIAIAKAARYRNIPVSILGNSLIQLGYGKRQVRLGATLTQRTSCLSADLVGDKQWTREYLKERGIPVPQGQLVNRCEEALEFARKYGYPIVLKPRYGHHGDGVLVNLQNQQQLLEGLTIMKEISQTPLIEQYIPGRQYRLAVVGGRLVAAAERIPPSITGDGHKTIDQLIEELNKHPLRGRGHELPLTKIKIDEYLINNLKQQSYTLESIPEAGVKVWLYWQANLSKGAIAADVTDLVHKQTAQLVCRAVELVGLDVAGVDLVCEDISLPLLGRGAIIEINAAPGIRMHHHPTKGASRNVGGAIVDWLFPAGETGRIPLVSVTGTNGKTTTVRMIGHILEGTGGTIGRTTSDGIYIGKDKIVAGDTTGPRSARVVLTDPSVEMAVLEVARGGLIRGGLGYDWSDVAVITNISEDHLGQDGVDDLEELAMVKSLVGEAVRRGGQVVLNADDYLVQGLATRFAHREIMYFSMLSDSVVVRKHLAAGGRAILLQGKWVTYAQGDKIIKIVRANQIPATLKGLARHNLQNALAATAASLCLGTDIKLIKKGLLSFNCDLESNPGRQNFFNINGVQVLVDYGHNIAAFASTLAMARKGKFNRIIGVAGVPGDRSNESIVKAGAILGAGFDYLYIKEDADLRGRAPGEVAELLIRGIKESTLHDNSYEVILNEIVAVNIALDQAEPGDLVVIFYEKLDRLMKVIRERMAMAVNDNVPSSAKQMIG